VSIFCFVLFDFVFILFLLTCLFAFVDCPCVFQQDSGLIDSGLDGIEGNIIGGGDGEEKEEDSDTGSPPVFRERAHAPVRKRRLTMKTTKTQNQNQI
jgi:hypothetical protein